MQLRAPRHAYLWDHAVLGSPLMPAAGMLELARAAASAATLPSPTPASPTTQLLLSRLAIPAPFVLPRGGSGTGTQLLCAICPVKGAVEVWSGGHARAGRARTHLTAHVHAAPAEGLQAPCAPTQAAEVPEGPASPGTAVLAQIVARTMAESAAMLTSGKAMARLASSCSGEPLLVQPALPVAPPDMLDAALQLGEAQAQRVSQPEWRVLCGRLMLPSCGWVGQRLRGCHCRSGMCSVDG